MKKRRYKYASLPEAEKGKAATVYGAVSLLIFLVSLALVFFSGGEAGSIAGVLGLVAFLFALCGFYMGLSSFSQKNRAHVSSVIGSLLNGLLAVAWLGIYLAGLQ